MAEQGNVDVFMRRLHLHDVPVFSLPEGFSLHKRPDKEAWVAIQSAAEPFLTISGEGDQVYRLSNACLDACLPCNLC